MEKEKQTIQMKNTSKKKRYTKKHRSGSSTNWIRDFKGENIVKEYSKWYGVDLICAIKELRDKGIIIDEEYEEKIKKRIEEKRKLRQINKEKRIRIKNKRSIQILDLHLL